MDEIEILAEALNEVFGSYPWDRADKPAWRIHAMNVNIRMADIRDRI